MTHTVFIRNIAGYVSFERGSMNIRDLLLQARSYRRFREDRPVPSDLLIAAVDAARYAPASANAQVMRYAVCTARDMREKLFPHMAWAGKLKDWPGPAEGERPTGYIVIGGDEQYPQFHMVDLGIASQSMFLFLSEAGYAACMMGSINAKAIHEVVGFPDTVKVLQVLAVGYPGEKVVLDEMQAGGDTSYYRDANDVHHVPKRPLQEVLLRRFE